MKHDRYLLEVLLWVVMVLLVCTACERKEPVRVDLKTATTAVSASSARNEKPVRIGMGAMITPKEGYVFYQRLQEYIGKRLGRKVLLVDRDSYDEMNRLLETGGVDAAFVCAGPYVEGKKKFGMELLAMPLVKGKPIYYSYIIVNKESPIKRFEDLRGKVFAFTDPKSNTGKLVPTYMLARINETPDSFFGRHSFTGSHDQSIRAVAEKLVDGAAVDSLIWEFTALKNPKLAEKTRIITTSDPYGIPPVVVRPGISPELKRRLQEILLTAAEDAEGREILKGMMIDRFVAGDDANYDTIRQMDKWVAGQRKEKK